MHPELYLVVYRQQEKELEALLERRRMEAERADDGPGRAPRRRAPWRRRYQLDCPPRSSVVNA